jgi:hypothetical protein
VGKRGERIPKRQKCTVCDGKGGWWQTGNGQSFPKRKWITCWECKGEKYV